MCASKNDAEPYRRNILGPNFQKHPLFHFKGLWFLNLRSWCQDLGTRILVPGSWYQDLGTKILVPRSWYQDPGTKILVPRSWYQDPGTKILVPRPWYQDPGTNLVPRSWYQDLWGNRSLHDGGTALSDNPNRYPFFTVRTPQASLVGEKLEVLIHGFWDVQIYEHHKIWTEIASHGPKWAHGKTGRSLLPQDDFQTPPDPKMLKTYRMIAHPPSPKRRRNRQSRPKDEKKKKEKKTTPPPKRWLCLDCSTEKTTGAFRIPRGETLRCRSKTRRDRRAFATRSSRAF